MAANALPLALLDHVRRAADRKPGASRAPTWPSPSLGCAARALVGLLVVLLHATGVQAAAAADAPPTPPASASADTAVQHAAPALLAQAGEAQRRQHSAESIAILFPDIGEPYRKVFADIVDGIDEQAHMRVRSYRIGANQDPAELTATLKHNGTRVVIALGRQGLNAAATVDPAMGVVIGGVVSVPDAERQVGICLTPDPALLFAQLRSLLPTAKRVIVIYNPQQNDWLIRLAREAARGAGLELAAFEARDLAGAARLYETLLAGADAHRDALWLPQDSTTVDETTILPLVLREAWNRSVPIFSSSVLHVKKGALFALYPNNVELGRNLASLAIGMASGELPRKGVSPLREVYAALNLRTASHIGLSLGARQQRGFDFLFPEP